MVIAGEPVELYLCEKKPRTAKECRERFVGKADSFIQFPLFGNPMIRGAYFTELNRDARLRWVVVIPPDSDFCLMTKLVGGKRAVKFGDEATLEPFEIVI